MRILSLLLFASLSHASTPAHTTSKTPDFGVTSRTETFQNVQINAYGVSKPLDDACERTTPPIAVDTPNPIMQEHGSATIDFIVGWDGKIYSGFLLEVSDAATEKAVVNQVRSWRYRPATCNGTPVSSEGRVVFKR